MIPAQKPTREYVTVLGPRALDGCEGAHTAWDRCVDMSGGLVMVSDDLECVGPEARTRLDQIVAVGRTNDDEARRGQPPTSPDLMAHRAPTTLTTGRYEVVVDVDAATSVLRAR
jgi:hypothetical protein